MAYQLGGMSASNGLKREANFDMTPGGGSGGGGAGGGKPAKIRRALAACKNCRKQKTRCDHSGGAPCHRCKVLAYVSLSPFLPLYLDLRTYLGSICLFIFFCVIFVLGFGKFG